MQVVIRPTCLDFLLCQRGQHGGQAAVLSVFIPASSLRFVRSHFDDIEA
jgi:hypothetical protein